ncbi:WAS/WASL-interacting protein family member 2-like [Gigantopelta aegis]|uniref:WAS/WASL-interacting protein family member 2-like n=1 Tax=Gigantopelta aegis TaxID=1735272 RepID=UPI001B888A8D|nr:WAS/WASL-interacting protein family member 2-like [Gigantopelta aegis]
MKLDPTRKRRRRKTDAPGADRGRTKPAAQLPAATFPVAQPQHRSTPARPDDPAQPDLPDDLPEADPDLNQAVMESPPTTPQTSAPGTPALPPTPRKKAAVESQARLMVVEKRKAIVSPGDQPAKPSPPTQPPPPTPSPAEDQPSGQPWSLQAGKLPTRYARLVKTNIGDVRRLLCEPSLESYEPLPRTEGEFSVRRITMNDGRGICLTVRRKGLFHQGMLLDEMDNPTIHRVIKTVAVQSPRTSPSPQTGTPSTIWIRPCSSPLLDDISANNLS